MFKLLDITDKVRRWRDRYQGCSKFVISGFEMVKEFEWEYR